MTPQTKSATETVKIHVAMSRRSELFSPFGGHLGCYPCNELVPGAMPGRVVIFESEAGVEATGIINFLEPAGSCIRPDMTEFEDKHKIHWTPISHDSVKFKLQSVSGCSCPSCGYHVSKVLCKTEGDNKRISERQCFACKQIWFTAEVYFGMAFSKPKRPRKIVSSKKKGSRNRRLK